MRHVIYIIIVVIISVIGFTLFNNNEVKPTVKNNISISIKYYDNAKLYKIDVENNKFYLIRDFKRKKLV